MLPRLIVSDPRFSAARRFAGTRVPVESLTDYLKSGHSIDEFLEDFPSVSRRQAIDFLEAARAQLTAKVA
jgi:uncharacterized protein (DUF433 family)